MSERIGKLQEQLTAALDAKGVTEGAVWRDAWDGVENELIERLLACEIGADMERARLVEVVKAVRKVRAAIESKARSAETLERELDVLEGRKMRPIA